MKLSSKIIIIGFILLCVSWIFYNLGGDYLIIVMICSAVGTTVFFMNFLIIKLEKAQHNSEKVED